MCLTQHSRNLAGMFSECGRCPNTLTPQAEHFDGFLEPSQEPLTSSSIVGMWPSLGLSTYLLCLGSERHPKTQRNALATSDGALVWEAILTILFKTLKSHSGA